MVYEYSNLVCAHHFMESHPDGGRDVILVFSAFLLNCQQLAEFLEKEESRHPDILSVHYSDRPPVPLPIFDSWKIAINKQLAHLSYGRVSDPKSELSETETRRKLFAELQSAFRDFLPTVREQVHRDEFVARIEERSIAIDLRLP